MNFSSHLPEKWRKKMLIHESIWISLFVLVLVNPLDAYGGNMQRPSVGDQGSVVDEGWGWKGNMPPDKRMSGQNWPSGGSTTPKSWNRGTPNQNWQKNLPKGAGDSKLQQGIDQWNQGGQKGGNPSHDVSVEDRLKVILKGIPGVDFPNYSSIPKTGFDCRQQSSRGYYGDVDAQCQVFHICQPKGRKDSFLCPLGTLFNQKHFVCDWWFNVNCSDAPNYYQLNEEVYKMDFDAHTTSRPITAMDMNKATPPQKWIGNRGGKSFDDWSSAGQQKPQGNWNNMNVKVSTVDPKNTWKRSDEGDNVNINWKFTGSKSQGNSATTHVRKDGNVSPTFNSLPFDDSKKPVVNKVKPTAQNKGNIIGFGARIKSGDDNPSFPKNLRNTPRQSTLDTLSLETTKPTTTGSRRNNIWFQGNNDFREPFQGDITSSTPMTQPETYISLSGTKGVWEQETVTHRPTTSTNGWKTNGGSHKGMVRKTVGHKLMTSAQEVLPMTTHRTTVGTEDRVLWIPTVNNVAHNVDLERMNNADDWKMVEVTTLGDENQLGTTTATPWTPKRNKRRRYADVHMPVHESSNIRKVKSSTPSSTISKSNVLGTTKQGIFQGVTQSSDHPSYRKNSGAANPAVKLPPGKKEFRNLQKTRDMNNITAKDRY